MPQKSNVAAKERFEAVADLAHYPTGRARLSAEIFICCPKTQRAVSTGLKTAWVIFRSLPAVAIPLSCPACGHTHRWKPSEAWVAPVLPTSPSALS
jgi:hypothetical protein